MVPRRPCRHAATVEVNAPTISLLVPPRDFVTEALREGAEKELVSAIDAEVDEGIAARSHLMGESRRQ